MSFDRNIRKVTPWLMVAAILLIWGYGWWTYYELGQPPLVMADEAFLRGE